LLAVDLECVFVAALLNFASWLNFRVLEAAVRAVEGHYYDFAEEGDFGQEESCYALRCYVSQKLTRICNWRNSH
jgi:hypothetical protein